MGIREQFQDKAERMKRGARKGAAEDGGERGKDRTSVSENAGRRNARRTPVRMDEVRDRGGEL